MAQPPLSQEEFTKLRSQGLSVSQIVKFEKGEKPAPQQGSTGAEISQGFVKRGLSTLQNIGRVVTDPIQKGVEKVTGKKQIRAGFQDKTLELNNKKQKTGGTLFDVASFIAPAGAVTKGANITAKAIQGTRAVAGAGKGTQLAANLATRGAVEGTAFAGISAATTGSADEARDVGIISALFPAAGKILGTAGKFVTGSKPVTKAVEAVTRRLPEKIVSGLIKANKGHISYGKNPSRAILEEGITANSLEDLGTKIGTKIAEKNTAFNTVVETAGKANAQIPVKGFTKPLEEALEFARKTPNANAEIITRLKGMLQDLIGGGVDDIGRTVAGVADNITPQQAVDLKRKIGSITKYTGNASDDKIVNKALQQSYGKVKESLGKVIPETKEISERIADLIGAKGAVDNRTAIAARNNIFGLSETIIGSSVGLSQFLDGSLTVDDVAKTAGAIGMVRFLRSPAGATRIASWLFNTGSKKKTEFFQKFPEAKAILIKTLTGSSEN